MAQRDRFRFLQHPPLSLRRFSWNTCSKHIADSEDSTFSSAQGMENHRRISCRITSLKHACKSCRNGRHLAEFSLFSTFPHLHVEGFTATCTTCLQDFRPDDEAEGLKMSKGM